MSTTNRQQVAAPRDAVCMDCRALELRQDPGGHTYYWCRTRRRRRPEGLLFAPACRHFTPQPWD